MKTFVSFGQDHVHEIDGKRFDARCIAVIHHNESHEGRQIAHDLFGVKFCTTYEEGYFTPEKMARWYSRGFIDAN